MQQIIYALGDIHADFHALNIFINKNIRSNRLMRSIASEGALEIILLQCGDLSFFWPDCDYSAAIKNKVDFLHGGHVKIYWCAGNHENHDMLDYLQEQRPDQPFIEVAPSIYFATFGAVLSLLDGTKVLFCGGAESQAQDTERRIKHEKRTGHRAWWPQEGISLKDMQALPDMNIDWIVSHARPLGVPMQAKSHHGIEPSQEHLECIRRRYKPTKWLHGHYHVYEQCLHEGCEFICLDHSTSHATWSKLVAHMVAYE